MRPRFLMCPPDFFAVDYSINPWMTHNLESVDLDLAKKEWNRLFDTLSKFADIELLDPRPKLPDMVFTANAGLVKKGIFIPSHFEYPERRGEEAFFRKWFSLHGYRLADLSGPVSFEGEGDALFQTGNDMLWMGYGFRTDPRSSNLIKKLLPQSIVSLQLIDPRFYHLDTCFCLLPNGQVMYYPGAFSADALQSIKIHFPEHSRIETSEKDALHFACNAISIEDNLILNSASPDLINKLQSFGYQIIINPVSEFLKAGGGDKCMALSLSNN